MDTLATCAQWYFIFKAEIPSHIYVHSSDHPRDEDHSGMFINLHLLRHFSMSNKYVTGLFWVYHQIEMVCDLMPRGKQQKRNSGYEMPEMIQFKLRQEELLEFEQYIAAKTFKFDDAVMEIMLEAHKVGVSWDAYNDCFISSLTAKGDDNLNTGKSLLSRSNLWQEAVAINLYKHRVMFKNGVWQPREDDNQRG